MTGDMLQHMKTLLGGYRITQALHVAAKLDIPDMLGDQP